MTGFRCFSQDHNPKKKLRAGDGDGALLGPRSGCSHSSVKKCWWAVDQGLFVSSLGCCSDKRMCYGWVADGECGNLQVFSSPVLQAGVIGKMLRTERPFWNDPGSSGVVTGRCILLPLHSTSCG
jgi:hypothetical protein